MRVNYQFLSIPQRYSNNLQKLNDYIFNYRLSDDIPKRFFTEMSKDSTIQVTHKPIKQDARFYKDTIILNFANDVYYLWAGICHESSHILLRKAGWEKTKSYKELKKLKLHYDIDQVIAILIQAYYEEKAGIRKLVWSDWQSTFAGMEVEALGKQLFNDFVKEIEIPEFSILKFIEEGLSRISKVGC